MAFAKGSQTVITENKKFIGVGLVNIDSINPTKEQLSKLYGTQIEKDQEYKMTVKMNDKDYPAIKIVFMVHNTPDAKVQFNSRVQFLLIKQYKYNRDQTKVQVIDKYARTCWVTIAEAKEHAIPMYKNGPAQIDKDYRPCFIGEENLTKFIKLYLGIDDVLIYKNQQWVMVEHPEQCEARLDNITKYFDGDVKELSSIINLQPNNSIKVLFGIKNIDGNMYQDCYTNMFLRANSKNYTRLKDDVSKTQAAGGYPATEFVIDDIIEYEVTPTNFNEVQSTSSSPFDSMKGEEDKGVDDLPFGL